MKKIKAHIENLEVHEDEQLNEILQHLCDGIAEIALIQPLDPFQYMADFLFNKRANLNEETELIKYRLEIERNQILLQRLFDEIEILFRKRKELISTALELETSLWVEVGTSIVTAENRFFLDNDELLDRSKWIQEVDAPQKLPLEYFEANSKLSHLASPGNVKSAVESILPLAIDASMVLQKGIPENCLISLSNFFRSKSPRFKFVEQDIIRIKSTCIAGKKCVEALKCFRDGESEKFQNITDIVQKLDHQLCHRDKAVRFITTTTMSNTTEDEIEGRSVFINGFKKWIDSNLLFDLKNLLPDDVTALRRAENLVMWEDETSIKIMIARSREYKAAIKIQTKFRQYINYKKYIELVFRRNFSATLIQNKYIEKLYSRAIKLPSWCVLGGDVIIAMSIAKKANISFNFYQGRDFPKGNYHRETDFTVESLKEICRLTERCAGFATNGTLKRFIPRKLSQLETMVLLEGVDPKLQGIYIKKLPSRDEDIIQTGLIVEIPEDKFGLVKVVFDGIGIEEFAPVGKLSERWKKKYDFDEKRWLYVDEVTGEKLLNIKSYSEPHERYSVIQSRKTEYLMMQDVEYNKKLLKSCIKIQCAWRSKKARESFLKALDLRGKEKERELLVDQAAARISKKKKTKKWFGKK